MRLQKQHFLFACTFFFCLGGITLNFSLIFRLTDWLSFSPGQTGTFMALGALVYFLGSNLYLWAGSRFNPANIFPLAAVAAFICSFPLGYARIPILLYAAYWLLQLGASFYWPAIIANVTSGLSGDELNRRISHYQRSWMAALMIGPAIAGFMYRWNSTANFIMVNLSYSTVLLFIFLMRRYFKSDSVKEEEPSLHLQAALTEPRIVDDAGNSEMIAMGRSADYYRYRGWACHFCAALCMGIMGNILPIHLRDGLGFPESAAGMVHFFRCAAGFAGFVFLARFTAWHFKNWWFVLLKGGLAFCAVLLLLAGNHLYFFFLIAALFGLLNSGSSTTSVYYSSSTGKNTKRNIAFHEIYMSLGVAAGSAGGGFIYQHFNLSGMSLALLLVLALGIVIFFLLGRRKSASPVLAPEEAA